MTKWKFTLINGKSLGLAINGEETDANRMEILRLLKCCYEEIKSKCSKDEDIKAECDDYIAEIQEYIYDVQDYIGKDPENVTDTETIDDFLKTLYDFCDYNSIWVGVM